MNVTSTNYYSLVVQRLQDVATLGERILTLSCLCNTLETNEERCAYPEAEGMRQRIGTWWGQRLRGSHLAILTRISV